MKNNNEKQYAGKIIVLTGWRGAGKTTLCKQLIRTAGEAGWDVAGVLSPAKFENGSKTGIEVVDLRTNEQHQLARHSFDEPGEIRTKGYVFDPKWMMWANEVLKRSLPCDLFVMDELGPLELVRGEGWLAGVEAVDRQDYWVALVVVRPELLEVAKERWPVTEVIEVDNVQRVDGIAEALIRAYFAS